jgi:hypothetical protein
MSCRYNQRCTAVAPWLALTSCGVAGKVPTHTACTAGQKVTDLLQAKVGQSSVRCETKATDQYNRKARLCVLHLCLSFGGPRSTGVVSFLMSASAGKASVVMPYGRWPSAGRTTSRSTTG